METNYSKSFDAHYCSSKKIGQLVVHRSHADTPLRFLPVRWIKFDALGLDLWMISWFHLSFWRGRTSKTSSPQVCKARSKAKRCHQHVFATVSNNYLHPPTCLARRTVTSFLGTCYTYLEEEIARTVQTLNVSCIKKRWAQITTAHLVQEFIYAQNAVEMVIVENLFLIIYAQVRPRVSYVSLKQHPVIFVPFLED